MVAFRRGAALVSAAYLLGIIFVAFPTLKPVLFEASPSNEDFDRVERYLGAWWESTPAVKMLLHADIALTIGSVASKFATYTEQAWYFDGGSLILLIIAISLYISSTLNGLKMLHPHSLAKIGPVARFFWREAKYEAANLVAPNSEAAKIEPLTPQQRKETIQIISASIILIAVVLVGVILLQFGEWYAVKEQRRLTEQVLREEKAQKKQ